MGFLLLSAVTYVIEVFAQLPAAVQVFPASFVVLHEPRVWILLGSYVVAEAEGPAVDIPGRITGLGAL